MSNSIRIDIVLREKPVRFLRSIGSLMLPFERPDQFSEFVPPFRPLVPQAATRSRRSGARRSAATRALASPRPRLAYRAAVGSGGQYRPARLVDRGGAAPRREARYRLGLLWPAARDSRRETGGYPDRPAAASDSSSDHAGSAVTCVGQRTAMSQSDRQVGSADHPRQTYPSPCSSARAAPVSQQARSTRVMTSGIGCTVAARCDCCAGRWFG
jgi:hypothetical protein